jgi:transposase InsO family protein
MDNLSSHKKPAVRAAIRSVGARLLFLPPYSPDLNRERQPAASSPNEMWSMDFVSDALSDGRRLRALTVVDAFTREALAIDVDQARAILARWVHDYNTERPHSSLGYATPAAYAAELEKQRAGLTPPVASPALMRDNTGRSLVAAG